MKGDKLWNGKSDEETIEMQSSQPLENSQNHSMIQNGYSETTKQTRIQKLLNYLLPRVRFIERKITNEGMVLPPNYLSNKVDNTKYNCLTFIPMVFFHQFKHFLNFYFLLIALSQFVPALRVGFLIRSRYHLYLSNHHHHDCFLH